MHTRFSTAMLYPRGGGAGVCLGTLLVLLASSGAAFAQATPNVPTAKTTAAGDSLKAPGRPPLRMLRYKEDWSFLRDPARRTGFFDPIKYIPLGGTAYATVGADVRLRYEYFTGGEVFGRPDDESGFLLQRYMLHGDLHAGERLRLFAQLKSNVVAGQQGSPRPIDKDVLDVHQLFVDVVPLASPRYRLTLRAGRQEVAYGRMVDVREGPNVRLSFDAVRLVAVLGRWRVEGLLARPVEVDPGIFDDGWIRPTETLWGGRLQKPALRGPWGLSRGLTLYYFGERRERVTEGHGAPQETRHTAGLRLGALPLHASGFNLEGAVQWGTTGAGRREGAIRAWLVVLEGAHTFSQAPLQPRLGLLVNAASGDQEPRDEDHQTFVAPYLNPHFFGLGISSPLGMANSYHVHASLAVRPLEALRLTLAWDFFWRQSTRDAAYAIGGRPILQAPESRARFVGHMPGLHAHLRIGRHLTVDAFYEHFIGGVFAEASGPEADASFWALQTTFKF